MSANEYGACADALVASADGASTYEQILHGEAMAREWRQLAVMAHWQDVMIAALAECGIEPPPPPRANSLES